jgi:hypothetical protein
VSKRLTRAQALTVRSTIIPRASYEEVTWDDLERAVGNNFLELPSRKYRHPAVIGDVHGLTDYTDQDSYQRIAFCCRDVHGGLYMGAVGIGSTHFNPLGR